MFRAVADVDRASVRVEDLDYVGCFAPLKQRVDKRRDSRALREND